MQEGNKKKKWNKPKLIILTMGKPEEAVLTICKAGVYDTVPNIDRADYNGGCINWNRGCVPCASYLLS